MAEVPKTPAERPELRAAAPSQGGPLGSSGATGASVAGKRTPPPRPGKSDTSGPADAGTKKPDAGTEKPGSGADKSGSGAEKPGSGAEKPGKAAGPSEKAEAGKAADVNKKAEAGKAADVGKGSGETGADKASKDAADKAETGPAGKADATGKAGKVDATGKAGEAKDGKAREDAADKAEAPPKRSLARRSLSLVGRGGRGVAAWARRPSGRVILPSVVVVALIGLAGTAGVYLVPRALEAAPTPSATPSFGASGAAGAAPAPSVGSSFSVGGFPTDPFGVGGFPTAGATNPIPGFTVPPTGGTGVVPGTAAVSRPADALAGWAETAGTKVGIPVVALQAYGYAELVTQQTMSTCHLTWTTLAAVGKVASGHGSTNPAVLRANGVAEPTIFGLPLDGQGGRILVKDTDHAVLDQDPTYDREVGPMKLVPSVWQSYQVDADRDGTANINDIDDAALVAATQLCKDSKGGIRDLSRADSWWDAILNYDGGTLKASAQKVFEAANDYGRRSRS
ncbi:hypothetical protein [Actinoplanes sp. NPDC020271]|uniref:hypothetical protein n=1 Tax=Actinoplanes sp. NPDC020271 TaxID=3363896 RepID=UPI003792F212